MTPKSTIISGLYEMISVVGEIKSQEFQPPLANNSRFLDFFGGGEGSRKPGGAGPRLLRP